MQPDSLASLIEAAGGPTVVGAAVGRSADTVSRWKRGEAEPPRDLEETVARVVGVSADTIAALSRQQAVRRAAGA